MLLSTARRLNRLLSPALSRLVAKQLSTSPVGDPHNVHEVRHPDMQKEFRGREDNFPCLARYDCRLAVALSELQWHMHRLKEEGTVRSFTPRGAYGESLTGYQVFKYHANFDFKYGGVIPELELAYETWGELNEARDNVIVLHGGLSASSHARSHKVIPWGWSNQVNKLNHLLCSGEHQSRLVGEVHWPGTTAGHKQIFCGVLQQSRWLLWNQWPLLHQPHHR